jgi:hypothetical protein
MIQNGGQKKPFVIEYPSVLSTVKGSFPSSAWLANFQGQMLGHMNEIENNLIAQITNVWNEFPVKLTNSSRGAHVLLCCPNAVAQGFPLCWSHQIQGCGVNLQCSQVRDSSLFSHIYAHLI